MRYLLAASFMAAPGSLLFAKLMKPEVSQPREEVLPFATGDEAPANLLDAAALGASTGLRLALNVGAMLLAFIGLIALVNLMLGGIGGWFHHPGWSLQGMLGWLFAPVAWLAGIGPGEMQAGGSLIGQKLVLNEFVAYVELTGIQEGMTARTRAICSVALCGFANFSSIAILLGGLGGMAPGAAGRDCAAGRAGGGGGHPVESDKCGDRRVVRGLRRGILLDFACAGVTGAARLRLRRNSCHHRIR